MIANYELHGSKLCSLDPALILELPNSSELRISDFSFVISKIFSYEFLLIYFVIQISMTVEILWNEKNVTDITEMALRIKVKIFIIDKCRYRG